MKGDEKLDGEYVIFTYTTGLGKTPKAVEAFLAANPGVKAVVGSGSSSILHRKTFNFAAENIWTCQVKHNFSNFPNLLRL